MAVLHLTERFPRACPDHVFCVRAGNFDIEERAPSLMSQSGNTGCLKLVRLTWGILAIQKVDSPNGYLRLP